MNLIKNKAQKLLEKVKETVLAIVMDKDGTVKGGDDPLYQKANVVELLKKIARKNKYPVVITASGASALKSFSSLMEFYQQEKQFSPTFIGIGNGTALYRFDHKGRSEIYNLGLTLKEVEVIVEIWKKVYNKLRIQETDLKIKGLETFKKFMVNDWTGYIPDKYLSVFKQYNGWCFTEQIQVTVVFPDWDEEKQRALVRKMQEELDRALGKKKYLASRGDDTFLHITHTFAVDPKLFALQTIMKELDLSKNQVAVFGDMPMDNDKGMLVDSRLPFTFTNTKIPGWGYSKPPFFLPGSSKLPVRSVYQAIDYLLS